MSTLTHTLLLASGSPRRAELLSGLGLAFDVRPAAIDEEAVGGSCGAERVRNIALCKAREAARQDGGVHAVLLAADTLVETPDGQQLGKPRDAEDAARMLRLLSGTRHQVHTGIAVIANGQEASAVETSLVEFLPLTETDIAWYLSTGEPFDKAGAYGIQDKGSLLVKGIEGDFFNIMGLPLSRLNRLTQDAFGLRLTDLS